jgi:hypothetical protein
MAWYWPVEGGAPGKVTNPYGAPQTVTGGYGNVFGNKPKNAQGQPINTGVDIPGQAGQRVLAVDGGTIEEVRNYDPAEEAAGRDSTGGYGNSVVVRMGDGSRIRYSHMQQHPPFQRGQRVGAGAQLGTIGDTGNATGPHLDLEFQDARGQYADPMAVGGWTSGQATSGLPPMGPRLGVDRVNTGSGWRTVSELPEGARVGVPFRMGQAVQGAAGAVAGAGQRVLQTLAELPVNVQVGQRIGREQAMATPGLEWLQPGQNRKPAVPPPTSRNPIGPPGPPPGWGAPGGPGGPGGDQGGDQPPEAGQQGQQPAGNLGTPANNYKDYDREAVIAEIRRVAKEEGHPELAAVLIATAFQETGGNFWPGSVGDSGNSGGVFQENSNGRGAGIPMADRFNVTNATRRAVREFAAEAQKNPALLQTDPGTLAVNAQRPRQDLRPEYRSNVNANTKAFAEPEAAGPRGDLGVPDPSAGTQSGKSNPKLDNLRTQRATANQRLTQAQLDLEHVQSWADRPEQPDPAVVSQEEAPAYTEAVKRAKSQLATVRAARDRAQTQVDNLDKAIAAEETTVDTRAEKDDSWKLETVNGKPVWVNAKGETRPYTGPGSDPTKKIVGGTSGNDRYLVIDNGDGTVTFQENKNYTAPKPTQVSGTGPDTEYIGFVDESGKVTYQKNPGYNPAKAYEHDGRVTLIDTKSGRVISQTDTLPAEEREAATGKVLAETDKLKADAEAARIKADLDKKDAEEWAQIETAIKSGKYTPSQINTMVLQAARNVTDYANLLKAENERNTQLETQRSNLAKEETETRKTRVSEADSARQATESYGRYGVATAPWQQMLGAAMAPVTDVRKLGEQMNAGPTMAPVAERYDRQMQQQEEIQKRRRETEDKAGQPFFGTANKPGQPQIPGTPEPAALPEGEQPATNPNRQPKPGLAAVDLKDQGKPGWARTYYDDGSVEEWQIPGGGEPQADSPPPQESPQPEAQSSTAGGADYGAPSGPEAAAPQAAPAEAPQAAPPAPPSAGDTGSAGAGYMGMPGAQDASFKFGRDDQGPQGMDFMPEPTPPGGFWDGTSPLSPEQLAYINSQRQNLLDSAEGGGGALPAQPASAPGPDQHGVGGYFTGGGGFTREDGTQGWMPPMYVPRFAPGGANEGGGGGGGGQGGSGGPPKRRRMPVPGKHALALHSPGWARTHYDDGAWEDWHVEDGPSFEGLGGRGAGYHGEEPPTMGIGWDEGTGGGGGSIWHLPPTPGASPGMMGSPPMNPGGAFGGTGQTAPTPPQAGMSGGYAGPPGGYYGGPAQPTPNTPLSRLLMQHGVLPSTPGSAAGAPGTV